MGSCMSKDPAPASAGQRPLDKRAEQQSRLQAQNGLAKPELPKDGSGAASNEETASKDHEKSSNNATNNLAQSLEAQADKEKAAVAAQLSDKDGKILLLGSGESGKSTIVKQMKIIHKNGFSDAEAYEYRPFVYKNVLDCIKNVINAVIDLQPDLIAPEGTEPVVADDADAVGHRKHILRYADLNSILDYELSVNTEEVFSPDVARMIATVYSYPEVHEFMKVHQGKFYLIDSTHYFMTNLDRIAEPDYIPSQADILRTRKKTSGIYDFRFQMGGLNIHMFDVGGQRSERKKWIHCFDNVTLIIFCVALSEYDQVLLEENTQNRLEESLTLFDSVVNSRWFSRTSVVLFLNKIDIFASKLPYSPLEKYFPDYNGGDNINKAVKYILWRFTQVNRSGLNIYPHVTQATDTSNILLVFAAVKETLLENTLRDSGIL